MNMTNYTVGLLPVVGYYQLKGQRYYLGGEELGSHAALYTALGKKLQEGRTYRVICQAIGLGYMMNRVGWRGLLTASEGCPAGANQLMMFMHEISDLQPRTVFLMRYDRHFVRWNGGMSGITCEVDGWPVDFKAAKLLHFFNRMYEDTQE